VVADNPDKWQAHVRSVAEFERHVERHGPWTALQTIRAGALIPWWLLKVWGEVSLRVRFWWWRVHG
jgi:hypothetical protein